MVWKIIKPFLLIGLRVLSLLVYLATIISSFGGSINPDYLTLPSLLCLAAPYFAIFTIMLIFIWAFFKKIIFCSLGIITIIICLTPLSDTFPLGAARKESPGSQKFKIMSWNVIHTKDLRQPEYPGNRAVEYMINSGADIITLMELRYFDINEMPHFTNELRDSLFRIYPHREGLKGHDIKILSKYPVRRLDRLSYSSAGDIRFDFFEVSFPEEKKLVVGVVHLYSYGLSEDERKVVTEINSMETAKTSMVEFKGSIRQKLRSAFRNRAEDAKELREELDDISPDVPLIICGDFNDVPSSWAYNIVRGDDLRDAYAETNFGPAITYNLHAFYFHIDQMLYRGPLEALILTVGKIDSSDHYPLIGEFEFK